MRHFSLIALILCSTSLFSAEVDSAVIEEMNEHIAHQMSELRELQEDFQRDAERRVRDLERLRRRYERQDDDVSLQAADALITKLQNAPNLTEIYSDVLANHYDFSSDSTGVDGEPRTASLDDLLDVRTEEERRQDRIRAHIASRWNIEYTELRLFIDGNVDENELQAHHNFYPLPVDRDPLLKAYIKSGGELNLNDVLEAIAPNTAANGVQLQRIVFTDLQIDRVVFGTENRYGAVTYDVREDTDLLQEFRRLSE